MRNKEEIRSACAELLVNLRSELGLSKFKIANTVGISDKTWDRYEKGESIPDLAQIIYIYEQLNHDLLRDMLDFTYPDIYKGLTQESDISELRTACVHFLSNVATEQMIRKWDFIAFGEHGSSNRGQLEMFTMIDHLPMKYRYMIAEAVLKYWEIAQSHNELVSLDHVMPDVEIFKNAIAKGKEATLHNMNSYSSITKKED